MKTLIYYPALFCLFLAAAACKKNDNIQPRSGLSSPSSSSGIPSANSDCDTAKTIDYLLSNSTGIDSFVITFSGQESYTFKFPAYGSKTVSLKSGTYNVSIPPTGEFESHGFSMYGQTYIKDKGARYENVKIDPCTIQKQVQIN